MGVASHEWVTFTVGFTVASAEGKNNSGSSVKHRDHFLKHSTVLFNMLCEARGGCLPISWILNTLTLHRRKSFIFYSI